MLHDSRTVFLLIDVLIVIPGSYCNSLFLLSFPVLIVIPGSHCHSRESGNLAIGTFVKETKLRKAPLKIM